MVNENYRQIVAVKCIRFLRIYAAYLSKVVYKFFHGRIIKSQVLLNIYLETNYKDLYLEKKKKNTHDYATSVKSLYSDV